MAGGGAGPPRTRLPVAETTPPEMNGVAVVLAAVASLAVGVPIGVYLGRLRWYGRCAECRYRLGYRLADESRGPHRH